MMQNSDDFLLSSYHYDLPQDLIAQRPVDSRFRHDARLLVYNQTTDEVFHDTFLHLPKYLPEDSLLVFNQSKVFPSRLKAKKVSGGKAEIFFLKTIPHPLWGYNVLIKTRSKKNVGDEFVLPEGKNIVISNVASDGTFYVQFKSNDQNGAFQLADYLESTALIPIPPYIRGGESDEEDKKNYQTIYSKEVGSVAAPTAGLHFTTELFSELDKHQIEKAYVTLHVGLGTFKNVTTENILDHKMHEEEYFVSLDNLNKINKAKNLFAVGTTSLRVLESSYQKNINPNERYTTNIFLHPGKEVKSVQGLITNFHLPESTLLMLVSSLLGRKKTLELYQLAVKERYRFFSYGDGMLIIR
jgi:S-adenosylmethionine:tRNA ribosyltransferase-isomerase